MKRSFLLACILCIAGCSTSNTSYVKQTLATLPSGDQVVTMAEIHTGACQPKATMTRSEITWTRTGQPDRVLTVTYKPEETPVKKPMLYYTLKTRMVDEDRFVLVNDQGEPLASFDYDHARAYIGATVQPAWARESSARAGN